MSRPEPPRWDSDDLPAEIARYEREMRAWLESPEGREANERDERERAAATRSHREQQAQKMFSAWAATGVPRRIRDVLGAAPQDTPAMRRVQRWHGILDVDPRAWCLVLSSSKGTGKSVAAGWWVSQHQPFSRPHCFDRRRGEIVSLPVWWTANRLCRIDAYGVEFDALCAFDGPLVIDDLGSEYDDKAGFLQAMFDALVDARYSEYRPLLITTNLTATAFKTRYSERVADRIRDGGSFYEFAAPSMRIQKPGAPS